MNESAPDRARQRRLTDSLFFAILPDEAACAQTADLAERLRASHKLTARAIPATRLHITLHYLGAFDGLPADLMQQTCDAASTIALPPAEVTLDRIETFAGRRSKHPLVLAGDATESPATLEQALSEKLGTRHRHPRFVPHITLLYDGRRIERHLVPPIHFTAHEFALIRSHLGQSRHETLARWPLKR